MSKESKNTAERRVRDTEIPELWLLATARGKSWRVRIRRDSGRIDVTRTIGPMPAKRARETARVAIRLVDAVLKQLGRRP